MDFSKLLFRCSSLGHLMSETREKSNLDKYNDAVSLKAKLIEEHSLMNQFNKDGVTPSANWLKKKEAILKADALINELSLIKDEITLSEGAKTHCMDLYVSITTGRNTDIENKYIKKGNAVEEDAITLYSRVKKQMFKKNEEHLKNDFIMGTPDIWYGETIQTASHIPDIKASWDCYTFYRTFTKELSRLYFWQDIGYQWLSGARKGSIAYCLVNTPQPLIDAEIKRMWYKIGQPSEDSQIYNEMVKEITEAMTYDDIPFKKRLLEYDVEWSDEYPIKIQKYVLAGRKYLAEIHKKLTEKQC